MSARREHGYLRRVGPAGVDLWRCQARDCGDEGTLAEVRSRSCRHARRPGEAERDLLDAVVGPRAGPQPRGRR